MKKLMQKVLVVALGLSFVLSTAACKQGNSGGESSKSNPGTEQSTADGADESKESKETSASNPETTEPSGDATTLKVYTWWDVTKFQHLQKMQFDFETENPDIKLNFITIPSKYADTMITKLAGGEIPDVMMLAMDQVPRYALNGMLLPLDDLASKEYKDSLYPVVTDALTVDGTLYAAARDITPKVMYLNTKMFEEAGVDIPKDTWTMDEFVETAKKLTSGSGADAQWGYYWANYMDQTFALIAAYGGKIYSEDGKSSVLSTDPKTMEAVQLMYDLYNTYKVCPSNAEAKQFGDNEFSSFMANKVAMQIGALSTASTFDANGTEYTILPVPAVDGVSKTSSFVNTWAIPQKASNPELSWRVVEFLSGKEGQQIALDMNFGLPASKLVDTSAFEAKAPYNKYFVSALETAVPYPTNINGSEFQTMFVKECEQLWAGATTPEEFAKTVDENGAAILNK
jgi:multiple sugar transport system substrate-binding protein